MRKRAFTIIELIISIVIIGIVSLSFPMIMTQTGNNILVATQQEAILAAKTYMGTILSYPWDENTYVVEGGLIRGMILETNNATMASDDEFNRVTDTNLRPGNIDGNNRRRLAANSIFPTIIGSESSDLVDIDDFNNVVQNLSVVADNMDYIFQLSLTPTVLYVDDKANYSNQTLAFNFNATSAGHNITNIKMISMNVVNLASSSPNVNITLRAFSSNIGEVEPLKRSKGSW
jgi:prepilin-type N-terminal cleavage/methylation domain-containing protein